MSRALCASLFAVLSKMEAVIKGKKVIVSLRVLTFSTFEGKKVIVSRVEMDHNRHVDAGEQCFAASFKTELGREPFASLFAVLSNVEAVVRVRNFKL